MEISGKYSLLATEDQNDSIPSVSSALISNDSVHTERNDNINTEEVPTNSTMNRPNYGEIMSDMRSSPQYGRKVFSVCLNTLVHTLIGASVFVTLWFAFKSTPVTNFQLHIGLSMIGYQLLMSHAILSLNTSNSWSSVLTFTHRRRMHWILQLIGSVLAIAGSALMMKQKAVNFTSLHGKLALVALIFTCISLINGVVSLYKVELRRFIPVKLFKISHVVVGTAAFALSTVCLAFGYLKGSFKKWASEEFSYLMIGITSLYTVIIIAPSLLYIWRRTLYFLKVKLC